MIIDEINKIEKHLKEDEIILMLDDLYDEFRDGRDRNDILILLNSKIEKMRYYGCHILNETSINDDKYTKKIMAKLEYIIEKDASDLNKIRAFDALYGIYLDNVDTDGLFLLCKKNIDNPLIQIKNSSIKFLYKYETKTLNSNFSEFIEYLFNKE